MTRQSHSGLTTIHGFQVQSYGKRLSPGFNRGLRRLAERHFDDANCVVVKTTSGRRSGITHAGGAYIDPSNPCRTEVMRQMRELGMEPPQPPFLLAPGECTLYHEWGHYVDRRWSGDSQEVVFSFRWLSRFYELGIPSLSMAHADHGLSAGHCETRPIQSDIEANSAAVLWSHASSELFANLFEDWMRGDNKVGWDHCEPESLNVLEASGHPCAKIKLLPGVLADDVRAETYTLFKPGTRSVTDLPPVRSGLFGESTDEVVDRFRDVLAYARTIHTA